jgi:3-deoxy-7-phosphoheptulonate synthase
VARAVAEQRAAGQGGLVGLMLESFLVEGRQDLVLGRVDQLTRGQSVTDACIDWPTTVSTLREVARTSQPATQRSG